MTKIETNLETIDALSRQNWGDNWNFREFLLGLPDPQVIDAAVQQLNLKVTPQIDCTTCGNCCRNATPSLTKSDSARLALALGLNQDAFEKDYVARDDEGVRNFCKNPCAFLAGNRCSVYAARPDDCRSYPHLYENDFLAGSVATIENYRVCPIVFNVYEQLKVAMGYDPAVDYIGEKVIDE